MNQVIKCEECRSIFTKEPSPENTTYTEYEHQPTAYERLYAKMVPLFVSGLSSQVYVEYLKEHTQMQFRTALDIGTGYGTLVRDLNKLGIDAEGIESFKHHVQLSASNKVKHANFDLNFKSDKKYDLICFAQAIYFLRDTLGVLKMLHRMLNKDGMLFIATTNTESPHFRRDSFEIRPASLNMIVGKKFYESLKDSAGFEFLDCTTYRPNIVEDMHPSKNKTMSFLKYRLGLKKAYVKDPDGLHLFILLKKINHN